MGVVIFVVGVVEAAHVVSDGRARSKPKEEGEETSSFWEGSRPTEQEEAGAQVEGYCEGDRRRDWSL